MKKCRYCWRKSRRCCAGCGERGVKSLPCRASTVRYPRHAEIESVPRPEHAMTNVRTRIARQGNLLPFPGNGEKVGVRGRFSDEQRWCLEKMAEHIASNLGIGAEDFESVPFNQRGGLGKVHQLFGAEV